MRPVAYESPTVEALLASWQRTLRARNRSARTIGNYAHTARMFTSWCDEHGHPTDPARQTAGDVEAWLVHQLDHGAASASVHLRFACLKQWFAWLVDEEEIAVSPMARLKPPKMTAAPVPVLMVDEPPAPPRRLRRHALARPLGDLAIIRLFIDKGCGSESSPGSRRPRSTSTAVPDRERQRRLVLFGTKTTEALDRYSRPAPRDGRSERCGSSPRSSARNNRHHASRRAPDRQAGSDATGSATDSPTIG